jgi:hypothetical protein
MSVANPLWGAPPIHGELLKLGMDVDQTTVVRRELRRTPHMDAAGLCPCPTLASVSPDKLALEFGKAAEHREH